MNDILITYGAGEARAAFYLEEVSNAILSNVSVNMKRLEQSKKLVALKNSDAVDYGIK